MESTLPFKRLSVALANLIASSQPGERLPSEPELARRLGVSRATLREAMRAFESQGLIRRKQGIGTFVVGHTHVIESGLEVLESIETLAERIGLDVTMGDLKVDDLAADATQAEALGVPAGSPLLRVARVITAENRPVAYLIDALPADVLQVAELGSSFTGSVLDLLLQRGTPVLANSRTEIRAVAAPSEVARALQIQRGDGLLLFVAFLYSQEGRMVDYSLSYFLPGYFRFHVVRSVGAVRQPAWITPQQPKES